MILGIEFIVPEFLFDPVFLSSCSLNTLPLLFYNSQFDQKGLDCQAYKHYSKNMPHQVSRHIAQT